MTVKLLKHDQIPLAANGRVNVITLSASFEKKIDTMIDLQKHILGTLEITKGLNQCEENNIIIIHLLCTDKDTHYELSYKLIIS